MSAERSADLRRGWQHRGGRRKLGVAVVLGLLAAAVIPAATPPTASALGRPNAAVSKVKYPKCRRVQKHACRVPGQIRKQTTVLSSAALQGLPHGHPITGSPAHYTLKFTHPPAGVQALHAGSVIASGVTPETPYGLLRKVVSVQQQGGTWLVRTVPATLSEAIGQGSFHLHEQLRPGDVKSIKPLRRGVFFDAMRPRNAQAKLCTGLDVSLYEDKQQGTAVKASGRGCLAVWIDITVNMHWLSAPDASFTVGSTAGLKLKIEATAPPSSKFQKTMETELAKLEFHSFVVWVGLVPIVLTPELSLKLGVDIAALGSIEASISTEASFDAGISYDGSGFHPHKNGPNLKKSGSLTPGLKANLTGYIDHTLELKIDGAVGPETTLRQYVKAEVKTSGDPWWTVGAGIKEDMGFKLNFIDKEAKRTLFDLFFSLSQSTGEPPSTPTPTPTATSVVTATDTPTPTPTPTPTAIPRHGLLFSFSGLHSTFTVNGFVETFGVSGQACGTDPLSAIWTVVRTDNGLESTPPQINFATQNPSFPLLAFAFEKGAEQPTFVNESIRLDVGPPAQMTLLLMVDGQVSQVSNVEVNPSVVPIVAGAPC